MDRQDQMDSCLTACSFLQRTCRRFEVICLARSRQDVMDTCPLGCYLLQKTYSKSWGHNYRTSKLKSSPAKSWIKASNRSSKWSRIRRCLVTRKINGLEYDGVSWHAKRISGLDWLRIWQCWKAAWSFFSAAHKEWQHQLAEWCSLVSFLHSEARATASRGRI